MKGGDRKTLPDRFNAWLAADAAERERAETPVLPAGSMVGPYRLVSLIARGGMGDVYRATDVRLHRDIALKVVSQSRTGDPQRVERFMHEARVTASLDHPNVVRVYDVGRADGRAYLVAELLEGETLRARIARGPMPVDDVVRIGLEIAKGLAAAHAAGLVHRDLKPDNIFLAQSGVTKIVDFGIAKLAENEADRDGFATMTGVVLGTAGYLAPEQIRGEPIDARADLFALGVVLFEMLTGTRAFARAHLVETLHAILHDSPSTALAERGDVPLELVEIVMRLLEKALGARVQSSAELLTALERVPTSTPARGRVRRLLHRWGRARRMRSAAASRARMVLGMVPLAAAVLASAAGGAWYWLRPTDVTLAVMPFESIPGTIDTTMADGLADAFISRLGQLPGVRVLPLTATARLRGQDPLEAARRLGATRVLTVRLQQEGDAVRATPHLLSAADGQVIWTTTVPTEASQMFTIQDSIVKQVLEQLAPRLSANASTRITAVGTRNNEAYQVYVRGRAIVLNPTVPNLKRAIELFEQAVKLDPQYADAWAGLGSAYKRMPPVAEVPAYEAHPKAKDAALRALAIQPDHPEAHSVLGTVALAYEWNYGESERRLRRALELQPSSADAQLWLALLLSATGRHDEALLEIRRARTLDLAWPLPRSQEGSLLVNARQYDRALQHLDEMLHVEPDYWTAHVFRMQALLGLGRYEEAVRQADEALELRRRIDASPRPYPILLGGKGYALARMERHEEARVVLEELRREGRERYVSPYHEAIVLVGLGQDDEAMSRLEAAVARRDNLLTFLGGMHFWDGLRDNPRFRRILDRVHLVDVSDRIQR